MSQGFSADWLSLREPYDGRACDRQLLDRLGAWSRECPHLRVVDLGSGTGANLRRTAPVLAGAQSWTLLEWDLELISAGGRELAGAPVAWRYRRLDLAADLEQIADAPCELVTASALMDLVSAAWLERLEAVRRRLGAALYVGLTYAGGVRWTPADPFDGPAQNLVDRHQRTDKGFGPALGPEAGPVLETLVASSGRVSVAASPWHLGPADREIQAMLLAGYAAAAGDIAPDQEAELHAWAERRRARIDQGGSQLEVAHQDLLLLPG